MNEHFRELLGHFEEDRMISREDFAFIHLNALDYIILKLEAEPSVYVEDLTLLRIISSNLREEFS
ncbi:hypothetical protein [Pseudoneobacillus sp. C159]